MSLFRRPKKQMQRRVYGADYDEDNEENNGFNSKSKPKHDSIDIDPPPPPPSLKEKRSENREKKASRDPDKSKKSSLLSFGDDEEDESEMFQVKKTSHSKKVMKMMDKERRKKKAQSSSSSLSRGNSNERNIDQYNDQPNRTEDNDHRNSHTNRSSVSYDKDVIDTNTRTDDKHDSINKKRNKNSNSSIQTEIRTDDFVLVVKQSEPHSSAANPNLILNGRAALCAGRDDMSSEDEESATMHRFAKPDHFKAVLESGAIPDAAMIHEARKKRQKAREQGEFIELEEKKPVNNKKGRLVREDVDDDDQSDEERVDMAGITGGKERAERMEKFYAVQREYSDNESDPDMDEWENQQIRKGVSGAQLVSAQHDASLYSQYLFKQPEAAPLSTSNLLEQAYATSSFEKPRQLLRSAQKSDNKPAGIRKPQDILNIMTERFSQVKELHEKHQADIERITMDLKLLKMQELEGEQNAPVAASKFHFFQKFRGYVQDLVECLDEKVPKIVELERKAVGCMSKRFDMLIERRRQDVRDQAKEVTQSGKPNIKSAKGNANEEEERIRRAAEREGRRTRRRRDRERIDIKAKHSEGWSSDDEIPDQEISAYATQINSINEDAANIFDDVTDEFSQISNIMRKFEEWRKYDFDSYKDTYVSLCLPKILGPMIRLSLVTWNPLDDNCEDFERMEWYDATMKYAFNADENDDTLLEDPDIRLIPVLVEKIILPKLTEIVEKCWDPLSSSQTLKLIRVIRRLAGDYPSVQPTSKYARTLFISILDKMRDAMDNDVFIPILPKQNQEGKSFFQRQFSSALKLLRNILSWQNILSDSALKDIAITSLLNRYLLSALRVCNVIDSVDKADIIVNTLPHVWLKIGHKILESLQPLQTFLDNLASQLDSRNQEHEQSVDKVRRMLGKLHVSSS